MDEAFVEKARLYALRHHLRISSQLGSGQHGSVFVAAGNANPKEEQFGENWQVVEGILMILRTYGIHLIDVHPRNIAFLEDPQ